MGGEPMAPPVAFIFQSRAGPDSSFLSSPPIPSRSQELSSTAAASIIHAYFLCVIVLLLIILIAVLIVKITVLREFCSRLLDIPNFQKYGHVLTTNYPTDNQQSYGTRSQYTALLPTFTI